MAVPPVSEKVFIVYDSHEERLVDALKQLIEHWHPGLEAFYCRQTVRESTPHDGYRQYLREELRKASIFIFLLSREFRWSQYCQSEVGASVILVDEDKKKKRKVLPVLVPPIPLTEAKDICPALDGRDLIVASDPHSPGKPHQFVSDLKTQLAVFLKVSPGESSAREEMLVAKVETELAAVIEDYSLTPEKKELCSIWTSIDQENPLACRSIVENIKKSLRNDNPITAVTLVGVSLKYSLFLLDKALREYADENRSATRKSPKQLNIRMVHMDDQSHILYALHDMADIHSIQRVLRAGDGKFGEWHEYCQAASIHLNEIKTVGIDYIPPRIGILIDENILYAGRCAFSPEGIEFHLLVGQREYFHYTDADERGREMIREFKSFLEVYNTQSLNGIELVADGDDWLRRLHSCVLSHPDIQQITLISQTVSWYRSLIKAALSQGISVRIYAQAPHENLPDAVKHAIEGIEQRIRQDVHESTEAKAEIFYFDELPTFRAALIGKAMLGIQMYVPAPPHTGRNRDTSPVRIIATKYSPRFKLLNEKLVDKFLRDAPKEPAKVIRFA